MKKYIFYQIIIFTCYLSTPILGNQIILCAASKISWKTKSTLTYPKNLYTYQKIQVGSTMNLKKQNMNNLLFNSGKSLLSKTNFSSIFNQYDDSGNALIFTSTSIKSAILQIDKHNNSILFNAGIENYAKDNCSYLLPSDEELSTIAKKHLYNLNLLPENLSEMYVAHIGGLTKSELTKERVTKTYVKLKTIRYERKINGVPVIGVGSKIIVNLGENGELCGLIRNWTEVEKSTDFKTNSNKYFKPYFVESVALKNISNIAKDALEVSVESFEYVLYDDGNGIIEPAVYVEMENKYTGGFESVVDFYVPVVKKSRVKFPNTGNPLLGRPSSSKENHVSPSPSFPSNHERKRVLKSIEDDNDE